MYMIKNQKNRARQWPGNPALVLALVLAGMLVSACSGNSPKPDDSEIFQVKYAEDRWDALLAGDYETAYAFYAPGYRSTISVVDFAVEYRLRRVRYTSAQYMEHSCMDAVCTVYFDVGFTISKPVPGMNKWDGSDILEEKWVKTDGRWWFLPTK
jgi:hypothetical protein